jgi:hypothetical protein
VTDSFSRGAQLHGVRPVLINNIKINFNENMFMVRNELNSLMVKSSDDF